MQKQYQQMKKSRKKTHRKQRAVFGRILATAIKGKRGQLTKVCRDFGISWKYLQECCASREEDEETETMQRKKDSLSPSTKKAIQEFF